MSRLPNVAPGLGGRPDLVQGIKDDSERKRREHAAALRAQEMQQQAGYQGALQQQRIAGQSGMSAQDANQQAALAQQAAQNRSALMQQQAGHEQQAAEQHVDLQGRLQQIQLTQSEKMRMERIRNGIADVNANGNLNPEEKRDLIMQMQTGLDPLQHRQSQANILHTQIQTRAAQQQVEQNAWNFHHHQSYLTSNVQDRLAMITDPTSGATGAYYMDERGNPTALDVGQGRELHQMNIARMGQQMGITAAMAPGQLEALKLQNQGARRSNTFNEQADPLRLENMQEELSHARTMNPLRAEQIHGQIAQGRQELLNSIQTYEHRGERAPIEIKQALANLGTTQQALHQNTLMGPLHFQHLQATIGSLEASTAHQQAMSPLQQEEAQGRIDAASQSLDQHARMFPIQVAAAKQAYEQVKQAMAQGGRMNPQLLREAQLRVQQLEQAVNGDLTPAHRVQLLDHAERRMSDEARIPNSAFARQLRDAPDDAARERIRRDRVQGEYNRNLEMMRPRRPGEAAAPTANAPDQPISRNVFPEGPVGDAAHAAAEVARQGALAQQNPEAPPPNPQAAGRLEPAMQRVAQARDAIPATERGREAFGPHQMLSEMHDILHRSTRANRDLTPTDQRRYEQLRQGLADRGHPGHADLVSPTGGTPRYVGTTQNLSDLEGRLRGGAEPVTWTERLTGDFRSRQDNTRLVRMAAIIRNAQQHNRGLAAHEVQEYNSLRDQLRRETHGRIKDNSALPE